MIGKVVVYNMEERQRVKIVDYVGSKRVEQSKIEEELKKKGITIRLDSFIDPGLIRQVAGIVRELYAEKGYEFADVKPEIKEVAGGPKLVHLTFHIDEGPKVKIRDDRLRRQQGDQRRQARRQDEGEQGARAGCRSSLGGGTYKEDKFEEDAENVVDFYRDHGYIKARSASRELKILEDSKDGKTRWVELRIPVTEGNALPDRRVQRSTATRSSKPKALRPLFKLEAGDYYSEKKIRKGLEKAQEVYGTGGYFEFTGYPDLSPARPSRPTAPMAPPRRPVRRRRPPRRRSRQAVRRSST